jgi:hypothetical protein
VQTATATKNEVELAQEKLAQAKAEYAAAGENLNAAALRMNAATRGWCDAQGKLSDLRSTKTESGKRIT